MTTIRLASVLIRTDNLPPIRSHHPTRSNWRHTLGFWMVCLAVGGAVVAVGAWVLA